MTLIQGDVVRHKLSLKQMTVIESNETVTRCSLSPEDVEIMKYKTDKSEYQCEGIFLITDTAVCLTKNLEKLIS